MNPNDTLQAAENAAENLNDSRIEHHSDYGRVRLWVLPNKRPSSEDLFVLLALPTIFLATLLVLMAELLAIGSHLVAFPHPI